MIVAAFLSLGAPMVLAEDRATSNVEWLLEQYTLGREEYVILDEYFNRIGYIRRPVTIKEHYGKPVDLDKYKRDKTPFKMRGVSTFKERRSHEYGPKHKSRIR